MSQHKYLGHLSNARSVGVEVGNYVSDRYGPPKPEIETVLHVNQEELTLAHLNITPENNHIPATVLHQLKQLTYR